MAADPYSNSYLQYNKANGTYTPSNASWFNRSWWNYYEWAKSYVNNTGETLKLRRMMFVATSGHSNGRNYMTSTGLSTPCNGGGCVFEARAYVVGGQTSEKFYGDVPTIYQFNCVSGGVRGLTSLSSPTGTSFGSPAWFGPDMPAPYNAPWLCRTPVEFTTPVGVEIPPGATMYVRVSVSDWKTNLNDAMLTIKSPDPFWDGSFTPEPTNYIWRRNEDGTWKKERKIFVMTSNGWLVQEGD